MPIEGLVNLISAKIFQAYRRKSGVPFLKFMASIEKAVLAKALESSPSVVETAKTLKMKRTTLMYKMGIYKLKKKRVKNES